MTKEEKLIVSAYTGILMTDFNNLHEFIEKKLGRPVLTHDLANELVVNELKEAVKEDFLKLCAEDTKEKYLHLKNGDDIYYVDSDNGEVEHGKIFSVAFKDGEVDSFSVDFDCGDFDEFSGGALGVHYFINKEDAETALRNG